MQFWYDFLLIPGCFLVKRLRRGGGYRIGSRISAMNRPWGVKIRARSPNKVLSE